MWWFFWTLGSSQVGQLIEFCFPKNKNFSFLTLVLIGALFSFQSGISSSKALVSKTFPLKIWAPTSDPFSNIHTFKSGLICYNFIDVAKPAGPAPTMTTSYSIESLWISIIYNKAFLII